MRYLVILLLFIGVANAQPMRFFLGAIGQYPPIVTNGLIANITAQNSNSYNGIGSLWYDISGMSNNTTLVSSPTFNTSKNGYFTFNGNQYASFGKQIISALSSSTVCLWVNVNSASSGGAMYCERASSGNDIFKIDNGSNFDGFTVGFVQRNDAGNLTQIKTSVSILNSNWTNICVTNNANAITVYINGVSKATGTITNSTLTNSGLDARIASDKGDLTQGYNGFISVCQLYNRALTSTEVAQNFNALKSRYGL